MSDALKVLHIDDDKWQHLGMDEVLAEAGQSTGRKYERVECYPPDWVQMYTYLAKAGLHAVLLDHNYRGLDYDGTDVYEQMLEIDPGTARDAVAIYTSLEPKQVREAFNRKGVEFPRAHVQKPISSHMDQLVDFLQSLRA